MRFATLDAGPRVAGTGPRWLRRGVLVALALCAVIAVAFFVGSPIFARWQYRRMLAVSSALPYSKAIIAAQR